MHKGNIDALLFHFSALDDPRIDRTKKHNLIDILAIAVCAFVAGGETWQDVEDFGNINIDWLCTFLALPNGIPSHDTFARVFSRLNPKLLQEAFISWTESIQSCTKGKVVAIDGKTLRRSFDTATNCPALHMVSAWSAASKLVLGQVRTEEKSNEIKATPKLLDLLNVRGAIVTIDAIGCQKEIASKIVSGKADYVLAVKANQPDLFNDIRFMFEHAERNKNESIHDTHVSYDSGHGRVETRSIFTICNLDSIHNSEAWAKFKSICMVRSKREMSGKTTESCRYYISSLTGNAKEIGEAIRGHWSIENCVHWVLDVTFTEDASRVRKDFGAENLAVLRRVALNLVRKEPSDKSMRRKRKIAGWNRGFLLKVLTGN